MPWWAQKLLDFLAGMAADQSMSQPLRCAGVDGPIKVVTMGISGTGYDATAEEARQRAAVVAFMRSQLGKAYRLGVEVAPGHEGDTDAWDCSEETEAAFRSAGMVLPDGSPMQFDFCQSIRIPKPGDLGFLWSDKWGRIGHVFVFTGQGTVVHAVGGRGVVEDPEGLWSTHVRFKGWRRHPDWARSPEDRA